MKYVVKVDYKRFEFDDREVALDYAEMSKDHAVKSVDVEIELVKEEEEKADPIEKPQDQQVTVTPLYSMDSQTCDNPRGIGVTWG